jgi:hypothetical protein
MSRTQIVLVVIAVALLAAAFPRLFAEQSKQTLCHKTTNGGSARVITVTASAVPAHLAHGDTLGACVASATR